MGEARRSRAIRRAVRGTVRAEASEATLEIVRGYARSARIWRAACIVLSCIILFEFAVLSWR